MNRYDRVARNIAEAGASGRAVMVGLARGGPGLRTLALFCAAEGYSRADAARAIGCTPEALDRELEAFAHDVTAERRRRQERRAS